jgi:butyryl-CoA dehydrogenase
MQFELTDEQRMIRDMAREFADKEVRPRAFEIDRSDHFPIDVYRKMGDLGLLNMTLPPDYGGSGADNISQSLAIEELAKGLGSVANACLLAKLQSDFLYNFGSEAQRRRWVRRIAAGETICVIANTEPGAGSDAAAIQARAVRARDGFVINGTKAFVTAGAVSDLAVVLAKTDPAAGHRGISAFLVERDRPGYTVGKKDEFMGMRGLATSELVFEDCWVPAENLIGKEGDGFKYVMASFNNGRIVIASLALGLAQEAMEQSIRYAQERHAFGQPIASMQAVQFMLADMSVQIDAARLLIHKAAYLKDRGLPYVKEAAHAKLFASDVAQRAATDAVQIHGGYGYSKEAAVERIYRDAKLTQIYEGTNQIQRMIIARQLLQSPARADGRAAGAVAVGVR